MLGNGPRLRLWIICAQIARISVRENPEKTGSKSHETQQ
jgi:hypothetical protein